MALLRRSGSRFTTNIWPGFVDAMTALLLVLMFVLSIFMVIQSVFREKITGQETDLSKLEYEVLNLISDLNYSYKNVPKLSETWFCCAEPSQIQLDRIKTNTALI